jgi:rRNA-processing protein FCF1
MASMPWGEEQERLSEEARLSVASPEDVVRELKRVAQKSRGELRGRKALEALLVERNDRLINLGLACYGTSDEVFQALYKHGLEKPADVADERYRRGLRIGCLSNRTVAHWIGDFPRRLIGPEEIQRIVAAGDDREAEALICNPSISDRLLEELYQRTGAFATLADERWSTLVYLSRRNERLVTNEDDDVAPDMGHYRIHHAIFRLLEIAPVDKDWLHVLYGLLDQLDFQQVARPETIKTALSRWAQLDDRGYEGKPVEGYFTSLSLKDEFRCLIAALYGRTWSDHKLAVQGSPSAKDVAMRCAYYGNAELGAQEMTRGYKRDQGVYVFATMYNSNLFSNDRLRKLFEEEQVRWGGELLRRYLKNFDLVRKERPYLESFLPSDERTEATNAKEAAATKDEGIDERAIARAVETAINKIGTKIFNSIYKIIFLLIGAYLVYNYGLYVLGFLIALVSMAGHVVGVR